MHPRLEALHPYPFEKLAALTSTVTPDPSQEPIRLSIGEPKHAPPEFVIDALARRDTLADGLATYPATRGTEALRTAAAGWAERRFELKDGQLDPASQVLPVNGTREALFSFAQALLDPSQAPVVALPNPFYQIYEGAALLAGAEPVYLECTRANGFLPDFERLDERTWRRCQLVYVCAPGNPTGAAMDLAAWRRLLELADRHDFIIAADECYCELYLDANAPPVGLLQACAELGRDDFARCVVFHSLSKRSNLPGLRSGFVAGDAALLARYARYRTYHGCAMPVHVQAASVLAWNDEAHVRANRARYREKFAAVLDILGPVLDVRAPTGGFYLWPPTPVADDAFARELYRREHVLVLPGSFLSRPGPAGDPGADRVRMALVAETDTCIDAAWRLRRFLETWAA